jgi:hypothetical protein
MDQAMDDYRTFQDNTGNHEEDPILWEEIAAEYLGAEVLGELREVVA